MTRDAIVELFERRQALLAVRDAPGLAALHAEGSVLDSPFAGRTVGRAGIEQLYRSLFSAFPDFTFEPHDLVIDGDRAVHVGVMTGTDTGGFLNMPPTGRPFRIPAVFTFKIHGGHFTHMQALYDFTGWLVQIGHLKAKPC
jgi:steroid delta-isomerase-like uncharacterized protein